MSVKKLRILIADSHRLHSQRLDLMLSHMGYCAIVVVSTFDEVRSLTQSPLQPFDVLMINKNVSASTDVDLIQFCKENINVRYALIYLNDSFSLLGGCWPNRQNILISIPYLSDVEVIRLMMGIIEWSGAIHA